MTVVRLWKEAESGRAWAAVGDQGREHLLAQLLHGNLLSSDSCALVIEAAARASAKNGVGDDLGFFNSVGVHFEDGKAILDHVVDGYGVFTISASQLAYAVSQWKDIVSAKGGAEVQFGIEP